MELYQDKKHQIWLWWAIDHETGEAIAFWFGTREHENIDRLLELLEPLNLWKVYTVRFSKTEQMHKIVVALAINVWFFGRVCLLQ
ncbi:MAG: hypothetical protein LBL76_08150 [Treponema sp.]|nr:hypothetical protein [Treponema sp.]